MLSGLSESDIKLLIEAVDPGLLNKFDTIKGDPAIIDAMLDQEGETLFHRVMHMSQKSMMPNISPRFLFEILLRRAISELEDQSYTVEKIANHTIPVFDARNVVHFLSSHREVLKYLADMLSSFTKVESFTCSARVRKGLWRKMRFSEMDFESLSKRCESIDEEHRFPCYKRIADLCLFILGIFPEYVNPGLRPAKGENIEPQLSRISKMSAEDFEEEGKRFYKLAGEHREARLTELAEVLRQLHQTFELARKPLNYISDNYLALKKQRFFPPPR